VRSPFQSTRRPKEGLIPCSETFLEKDFGYSTHTPKEALNRGGQTEIYCCSIQEKKEKNTKQQDRENGEKREFRGSYKPTVSAGTLWVVPSRIPPGLAERK